MYKDFCSRILKIYVFSNRGQQYLFSLTSVTTTSCCYCGGGGGGGGGGGSGGDGGGGGGRCHVS